jgi:tRNA wybutosine-synthesizing protein 3
MNTVKSLKFETIKENAAKTLHIAMREKKIDPLMIGISQFIEKTTHFFTTSTCSGRITLMDLNEDESKKENVFYRKWHRKVTSKEVWEAIEKYEKKGNLWLRQDAFVYVIGTNTWENVEKIIRACQEAGVKRYGVHHFEEDKIMMEIFGTQNMSIPLSTRGKLLVEKTQVKEWVKIANQKWTRNESKRKQFEKVLKKRLK